VSTDLTEMFDQARRVTGERSVNNAEVLGDACRCPSLTSFDVLYRAGGLRTTSTISRLLAEALRPETGARRPLCRLRATAEARDLMTRLRCDATRIHVRSLTVAEWTSARADRLLCEAAGSRSSTGIRGLDGQHGSAETIGRRAAKVVESAHGEARKQLHPELARGGKCGTPLILPDPRPQAVKNSGRRADPPDHKVGAATASGWRPARATASPGFVEHDALIAAEGVAS
jgi:hypothetical protein